MKIVIVSPGHLATNPRVVKEASALAAAGHEVVVIHGRYIPGLIEEDPQLVGDRWRAESVPFGLACGGLLRQVRQKSLMMLARLLMRIVPGKGLAGVAIAPVAMDLAHQVSQHRADLYIAHYPPALPAVVRAARLYKARYAFDAEDFHLGDYPEGSQYDFERKIVRTLEENYLPKAAYVTAASPGIAAAYAQEYGVTPVVVLNTFPLEEYDNQADRGSAGRPSVYWFSQTLGPDRGLECAVNAVALAKTRPYLYLRGQPRPGYRDQLAALAKRLGVEAHVCFLDIAPPGDMVRLASEYDAGFVGETGHTPNRRIALTNKQFVYLLAGLPVVMSDVPAHKSFSVDAAGAVLLYETENPGSLAAVFDELFDESGKLAAARSAALRCARRRFNWEKDAETLISTIESVA